MVPPAEGGRGTKWLAPPPLPDGPGLLIIAPLFAGPRLMFDDGPRLMAPPWFVALRPKFPPAFGGRGTFCCGRTEGCVPRPLLIPADGRALLPGVLKRPLLTAMFERAPLVRPGGVIRETVGREVALDGGVTARWFAACAPKRLCAVGRN